jgi:hypothetical protein
MERFSICFKKKLILVLIIKVKHAYFRTLKNTERQNLENKNQPQSPPAVSTVNVLASIPFSRRTFEEK